MHPMQDRNGTVHPILGVITERGLTQAKLAEMIDYSPFHLNRAFHKREPAGAKLRRACARALGLPESALFHDDTPSNTEPANAA